MQYSIAQGYESDDLDNLSAKRLPCLLVGAQQGQEGNYYLDAYEQYTRRKLYMGALGAFFHAQDLLDGRVVLMQRKVIFHLLARHALLGKELVVRGERNERVPYACLSIGNLEHVRGPKVVGKECAQLLERFLMEVLK